MENKKDNRTFASLIIMFDEKTNETEQQEIISKFYADNEKEIDGMASFVMKKGVNISKEFHEFQRKCEGS